MPLVARPLTQGEQVAMVLSVDADMFLSGAKLRAARLLWARVQEAMGLAPGALRVGGRLYPG